MGGLGSGRSGVIRPSMQALQLQFRCFSKASVCALAFMRRVA